MQHALKCITSWPHYRDKSLVRFYALQQRLANYNSLAVGVEDHAIVKLPVIVIRHTVILMGLLTREDYMPLSERSVQHNLNHFILIFLFVWIVDIFFNEKSKNWHSVNFVRIECLEFSSGVHNFRIRYIKYWSSYIHFWVFWKNLINYKIDTFGLI